MLSRMQSGTGNENMFNKCDPELIAPHAQPVNSDSILRALVAAPNILAFSPSAKACKSAKIRQAAYRIALSIRLTLP
jgi:hypothetical protein